MLRLIKCTVNISGISLPQETTFEMRTFDIKRVVFNDKQSSQKEWLAKFLQFIKAINLCDSLILFSITADKIKDEEVDEILSSVYHNCFQKML